MEFIVNNVVSNDVIDILFLVIRDNKKLTLPLTQQKFFLFFRLCIIYITIQISSTGITSTK
jgi:hypothetical protein